MYLTMQREVLIQWPLDAAVDVFPSQINKEGARPTLAPALPEKTWQFRATRDRCSRLG